jgi:hypothetical protein
LLIKLKKNHYQFANPRLSLLTPGKILTKLRTGHETEERELLGGHSGIGKSRFSRFRMAIDKMIGIFMPSGKEYHRFTFHIIARPTRLANWR